MVTSSEHISLRAAADQLGLHYMTVYRYVRIGKLPAAKRGGQWFVDPIDLLALGGGSDLETWDGTRGNNRELLEDRLLAADEPGAWAIVERALASGAEPAEIHLRLIIPVMQSIGDRWAAREITVVDEHRATVVANRVTARLGPRFRRRGRSRGSIIIGLPSGDPHALVTSILSDLLRGEGFDVTDLGANTPPESFAAVVRSADRLLGVALSSSLDDQDETVLETVKAIRAVAPAVPIILGGGGITDADHCARLGGDHFAPDAEGAVDIFGSIATS